MSDKFDNVIKFIHFLKEGNYGYWVIDHKNDGTLENPKHIPHVEYSEFIDELQKVIYDFNDHYPEFELKKYKRILLDNGIRWGKESITESDVARFDAQAIMALLFGIVQAERLCEGALLSNLKSGAILLCLERLQEIAEGE